MLEFIESPIFDNWFKHHIPESSLLICSPYVKQEALDHILKLYNIEESCANINLRFLIRGATEEFTTNKSSDITILDRLFALKGFDIDNFRRIGNLHMKAYLIDDTYLLITSGNLTRNGLFVFSGQENFEGGIATDEPEIIEKFKVYFEKIWEQGECFEQFYDKLLTDYEEYISRHYSDQNAVRRIRRKYNFNTRTQNTCNIPESSAEVFGYELKNLPSVGAVSYIDDTLDILKNNSNLTRVELGDILRKKLGLTSEDEDPENRKVNNYKFGEEKSNFLEYFDLVSLTKDTSKKHFPIVVNITNLGRLYSELPPTSKANYLKDCFFSKPAIMDILRKCPSEKLTLREYLLKYYASSNQATSTTLKRKHGSLKGLLSFVSQELAPDEELLTLINQIR